MLFAVHAHIRKYIYILHIWNGSVLLYVQISYRECICNVVGVGELRAGSVFVGMVCVCVFTVYKRSFPFSHILSWSLSLIPSPSQTHTHTYILLYVYYFIYRNLLS